MKKGIINISIISILMLMMWLLVPAVEQFFTSFGISLSVLSLLCAACFICMFMRVNKAKNFPFYVFLQLVMLVLWTGWLAYLYDNCYLVNKEQMDFLFFKINSYASFFPMLLFMLLPSMCILIYIKPNYKFTKIIEVLLLVGVFVNFILQIRAIVIYPDAVRAPITAEEMGYGHLLEGLVGYPQIYSIALLVPCMFSKCVQNVGKKKILPIILFVFTFFMIITSNLATAGIMAIVGILLYLFFNSNGKHKGLKFVLLGACIILLSMSSDVILLELGNALGKGTAWGKKLIELSHFFAGEGVVGDVKGRADFYQISWQSFANSPLFGSLFNSSCDIGLHSTVLDIMGVSGILGLALYGGFVYFSYQVAKRTSYYTRNPASVKAIYCEFVILILFKNTITSYAIYGTMFIALPLYFYLYSEEKV